MSRVERVSALIQQEIADILIKKINDKRIGFISITKVEVSKDFSHAWVSYSQIGSDEAKQLTKRGLSSATPFIKGELGKVLRLQKVPQIHFKYDDRIEKTAKLIEQINALSEES